MVSIDASSLPYTQIVSAKGMATFLYIGQVISALVCLVLSLWRLVLHDFLDRSSDASNDLKKTVVRSLYAFYVMAFLEAFIFLVEKTYWEYKISYQRLFERVDKKAELEGECIETIRSFFYKVYSRSMAISVLTGLEMDLMSYNMELLQSDDGKEVLGGSRILKTFVERQHDFHGDTLRRIGIKPGLIDRLVEMLPWHHQDEEEVRLNSAAIIKALVSSTGNGSRVIGVSGSLENIMSLILWDGVDRILHAKGTTATSQPLKINLLRNYRLGILKNLVLDHANCRCIRETRGLLAKLVDFIDIHRPWIRTAEGAKTIRRSLQLLNMLASTAGTLGTILRPAITNVVSAIPHLRDILHSHVTRTSKDLHHHAVDVLKHLALDKTSRKVDEVLKELWFQYVPKEMKELDFWRRYFIAVRRIQQEVINADSDNSVGRSGSNIERRLNFGGIGNESLRKDPLEEAAYQEAFSVITVPLSMIVRHLAATIEVGRSVKSVQELATQGGRLLDRDVLSNIGEWSGIALSFAAMKHLSGGRDKENKFRFSRRYGLGDYQTLFWSLSDADTEHEDWEDKNSSFVSRPKLPKEVHRAQIGNNFYKRRC